MNIKKVFIISIAVFTSVFLTTCKKVEVPTQPTEVKAQQEGASVIVSWKRVEKATNYRIYRSASKDYIPIATVSRSGNKEEKFIDNNPLKGMNYYKITAFNEDVESLEGGYATCNFTFLLPTLTTLQPTNITLTSATLGGKISYIGYPAFTERGVCWSTSEIPTTANSKKQIYGSETGEFTTTITDFAENTTYYVRAYAINTEGTAYGNQVSLKTEGRTFTLSDAYSISFSSAQFNCSVTSNTSVTDKGICYSSQNNTPTTEDSKISKDSGTGNYSVSLTGLTENTTYYARPYAVTNGKTFYGNSKSFKTKTPKGVVINDIDWATCNVDMPGTFVANPKDAGMFYQWNRMVGWSSTDPMVNSNGEDTWDYSTPSGEVWEKGNDPSPTGWRVPTRDENNSLLNTTYVTIVWTNENGVPGRRYTDKTTGNSIFLPAAGMRSSDSGKRMNFGTHGYFWSSMQSNASYAFLLLFDCGNNSGWISEGFKSRGCSVRPVAE